MNAIWQRLIAEERGQVVVIVAMLFPMFLLGGVVAVDVSRWNVHKRQLQIQADAAALAAGSIWQFPCNGTAETALLNAAKKYAGDAAFGAGRVNTFHDIPDGRHHVLYNSPTYYLNRTKSDPGAPPLTGHPCADNAIDVKVTETDVSAFWGHFLARDIDATARAELKTASSVLKSTPIGVPLPTPQHVYAQFVNESSNTPYTVTGTGVLADGKTFSLTQVANTSNPVLWRSPTVAPSGVQAGDKVGIRAVLSASTTVPTAIDCNAAGLECDSNEGNNWNGLMSLRQWPQTSPDTATNFTPFVKALRLDTGTCPDAYFADVPVTPSAGCKMTVNATVKFNSGATRLSQREKVGATIHLPSGDVPVDLAYTGSGDNWQAAALLPVTPNSARSTITLNITQGEGQVHASTCTNGGNNPAECKVQIDDAQRVFAANSLNSGYIQRMQIDQIDPATGTTIQSFANSLPACSTTLTTTCPYSFSLTIGVATLHIATPGERPVTLRILKDTTGNASKNGSLNCDTAAGTTLKDEIANGCNVAYRVAVGNECDTVNNFGDMAANPPNPYPCVQEKPGENKNAINQGMKLRLGINGNSCNGAQDNQWSAGSPDNLSQTDKRRIAVFLTDFGMFTGSGRDFIPVKGFAEFYITGWSGQEKGNPDNNGNGNNNAPICNGNDPVPGDSSGYLVGHFIKDVAPPGVQDNGQACDPTALDLCTAVLTR